LFGLILILFITINGCDIGDIGDIGDNNNGNGGDTQGFLELVRMDIEDADAVFIAPSPETSRDELYKITDAGEVKEVSYFDDTINKLKLNDSPSSIYNVDDNYIIICFGAGAGARYSPREGYLIRKSDGAVFSLKSAGLPDPYFQLGNYKNTRIVQNDALGNIYYIAKTRNGNILGTSLIKIDISDPANLIKADLVEITNGYVTSGEGFNITLSGHAVYWGRSNDNIARIRKSNGGLYNIPNHSILWIGLDDKIKYYNSTNGGIMTSLDIDNSSTVISTEYAVGSFPVSASSYGYIVKLNNRILVISDNGIFEIENTTNTMRQIFVLQISNVNLVVYSENYYYLSGNNAQNQPVLLKINPSNDVVTTLLPADQYDIYAMTISKNDTLTFNAMRMIDGAKVIGEISASDQLKILDATLNTQVVVLERIR
jgi:hypothetical protein